MDFWKRLALLLQKTWLRVASLIGVAFLVHLPSLQGQLIWDDNYLIGENPFFRSPIFSLEVFRHYLFLDSFSGHYRPVQNLSYMLDYAVWNGDLYGYHLGNIVWHAAAGVLLFFLTRRLFPTLIRPGHGRPCCETGAFLVALLWVLHPVHSAAVDYISGRADSLAFVLSCGAWLVYLRAVATRSVAGRAAGYVFAVFLLLLGLCAREIAAIWAAVFIVHLLFFGPRRSKSHRALAIVICVLTLAIYAQLRTLPGPRTAQPANTGWSAVARTGLVLRALGDYTRLSFFPTNLHMERSVLARRMFNSPSAWRDQLAFGYLSAAGLLAAGALLAGSLTSGHGQRLRIFGAFWFLLGFLPISNVVELNATSAEHWLYLPLVGLLLVVLGWAIELPVRTFRTAIVSALLMAAALAGQSAIRSGDWLNAQVFYERTIKAGGWSPRVAVNLAAIYGEQGRLDEARKLLEQSLAGWPNYPLARSHLAAVRARQGDHEEANALRISAATASPNQKIIYPRAWTSSLQLARWEIQQQRDEEALRVLASARERDPKVWQLAELQSEILRRTRGPDEALPLVQKFTDENWWQYSAYLALGKLKAQRGDGAGALAALRHACRLDIRETEALNLMTRIELRAENLPAALSAQERAVSRQPDEPSQYLLYSEVLTQMGRTEQAQEARATAQRLRETRAATG